MLKQKKEKRAFWKRVKTGLLAALVAFGAMGISAATGSTTVTTVKADAGGEGGYDSPASWKNGEGVVESITWVVKDDNPTKESRGAICYPSSENDWQTVVETMASQYGWRLDYSFTENGVYQDIGAGVKNAIKDAYKNCVNNYNNLYIKTGLTTEPCQPRVVAIGMVYFQNNDTQTVNGNKYSTEKTIVAGVTRPNLPERWNADWNAAADASASNGLLKRANGSYTKDTGFINQENTNLTSLAVPADKITESTSFRIVMLDQNQPTPQTKDITVKIEKESDLPSMTNGNKLYSLAGAEFNVWSDSSCSDASYLGTITTDSTGVGTQTFTIDGSAEKLYAKEIKAPEHYTISDSSVKEIDVSGTDSRTVIANFSDTPDCDPIQLVLKKIDSEGKKNIASLEDAEFTIKYYDTLDENDLNDKTLTSTWIIKTVKDDSGAYIAKLDDKHLVSYTGHEIYKSTAGVESIPVGIITIQETKAATDYTIEGGYLKTSGEKYSSEDVITMKCTGSGSLSSIIGGNEFTKEEDSIRGGISITKLDSETGRRTQGDATWAGAEFDLYYIGGGESGTENIGMKIDTDGDGLGDGTEYMPSSETPVQHITLDSEGEFTSTSEWLGIGKYKLVETKAPTGYLTTDYDKNTVTKEFIVNSDKTTVKIDVEDYIMTGKFRIVKDLADNTSSFNKPETGVEFTAILSSKIGEGKAYATYKDAYDAIAAAGKSGDIKDEDGNIILTKNEYAVVVTGEDGKAESNDLAYGTYTIRQTSHNTEAEDIDWNDIHGEATFVVNKEGQDIVEFRATNTPNPYYLNLTKKDIKTNKTVSLTHATFKIKMLKDADGNDVSDLTKDFTIPGTSSKMHIKDGYVTLKVGNTSYDKFRTSSQNDDSLFGEIIAAIKKDGTWNDETNENGSVMTPLQVLGGTYQIEEIETPEGYLELEEPVTIEVVESSISRVDEDGDYIYDIDISNDRPTGELVINKSITKMDDADQTLIDYETVYENIEFTLTAAENIIDPADGSVLVAKGGVAVDVKGNTIGKFNLNSDGTYDLKGIPMGKYVLKETSAPNGIVMDPTEYAVEFTQEDQTYAHQTYKVELSDDAKTTDWKDGVKVTAVYPTVINDTTTTELSKTDVTGGPEIEGATLTITDKDGNIVKDVKGEDLRWVSGKTTHKVEGLTAGETYTLTEEITADGYVKAESIDFTINADGTINKVQMKDKRFGVSKVDVGGNEIEGALIQVIDDDGNIVDEWTSTKEEHFIKNLEEGKHYTLHEEAAPNGYVKVTDVGFTVQGADEDGVKIDEHVDMIDKRVIFSKIDVGGNEIEGAEITVTDKDSGEVVDSWTSTKEVHYIENLEEGHSYILHEVAAPNGYVKATDVPFTVTSMDEDGIKVDQEVDMTDMRYTLDKTDGLGNEVEGATVTIIDKETGETVDKWVSTKEPHDISGLEEGKTYTWHEEGAPDGYFYAEDKDFTITVVDGEPKLDVDMEMVDAPIVYQINKVDDKTGEYVKGVQLTLTDVTDPNDYKEIALPNDGITTGDAMILDKVLIADHTYVLMETELVGGVYRSTNISFTVPHTAVAGEQVINVTMVDNVTNTAVVKVDNHGNYVEGAKMQLIEVSSDIENAAADEAVADKSEEAIDEGYLIEEETETDVPDEVYGPGDGTAVLSDEVVEEGATGIPDRGYTSEELGLPEADTTDEATKADEAEAVDEGYTIDEGTVVYEWTTGTEPEDVSEYVKGGYTYILREVQAPFGFKTMEDVTFIASGTKDNQQVIMAVDQRETYYVSATKVDATNTSKTLAGAELTLYTADGKVAKDVNGKECKATTGKDGVVTWNVEYNDDLFGTAKAGYYVKETKAPENYQINKDSFNVTLSSDYDFAANNPIKITVKDSPKPNIPTGVGFGIGIGVVGIAAGAGYMAMKKKSRKEDEDSNEEDSAE